MDVEEVGKRLKKIREEKRFKISDFANKLGYAGLASYSNIEKGKAKIISINLIFKAAEILGVSVEEILGLTPKTEDLDSLNKELEALRDQKEKAELSSKYLKVKIQKDYFELKQEASITNQFLVAYIQIKELQEELTFQHIKEAMIRIQTKLEVFQDLLLTIGESNEGFLVFSNINQYKTLMGSNYLTIKDYAKEMIKNPSSLIGEIPEDISNDKDAIINYLVAKLEKGKQVMLKNIKYK